MRNAGLLLFAALAFLAAESAQAQVASPEISTGLPRFLNSRYQGVAAPTFIPDNPAALHWDRTSRIGASTISGDSKSDSAGTSDNFEGTAYGVTWLKKVVSVGFEGLSYELAYPATTYSESLTNLALAIQPAKWLALGIGYELSTLSVGGQETVIESTTYGASLKMGNIFYMGFGLSKDLLENTTLAQEGERQGYLFGMGWYGGKKSVWHVEYSLIDKADFVSVGGVNYFGGYQRSLFEIEFLINSFMMGLAAHTLTFDSAGQETSGYNLDIGVIRKDGLTLILRIESDETTANTVTTTDTITSILIAFGFGKR